METKNNLDIKEHWNKILEKISKKVNTPAYEAWVKKTYPLELESNILTIGTPNEFSRNYLNDRYKEQFEDAIKEAGISEKDISVEFVITETLEIQEEEKKSENEENKTEVKEKPKVINKKTFDKKANKHNLNPKYTFKNFVVGNHNKFANAAAKRVAESPGQAYNPLFLYGGVGLGKTHLMHAIGFEMLEKLEHTKIVYLSSERFTNELINSLKDNKMEEFRNKYRKIDLLLIDDIQFIEGKERTQEEFFHTFNALYDEGKQIIISSDRPPKEISMEDRLKSRFEMGLLTDVQPPDFETRIAILKKKAEIENIDPPEDILEYIAKSFKSNVRELEGALTRVMAYASLTDIPPTVELARTILGTKPSKEVTLDSIQHAVSDFYGVLVDDLRGNKKTKEMTWARHVAMYISRDLTKYSLQQIAISFGRKDHTTVIHAFEKVKNLINTQIEIKKEVQKVVDTLV